MATKLTPTDAPSRGWAVVDATPFLYRRAGSRKLYARVRIPPAAGLPGSHKAKSLRTEIVAEAKRRLPHVVAELKANIERARREASGHVKRQGKRTPEEEAAWWRERLASGDPMEAERLAEAMEARQGPPVGQERDPVTGEVEYVYDPAREREAQTIYELATGERVPAALHVAAFIAGSEATSTYASRVRLAVGALSNWLQTQREGDNLNRIGRRCAAAFIDHLRDTKRHPATVRSLISALSSYWSWLKRRGVIAGENPWAGQDMPKVRRRPDDAKRPFTDEEVSTLLSGETSRTLHDLMRLGALTGMRLNEIGRLTVRDCAKGFFVVRQSKTQAGLRRVPVHPLLAGLLERRTKGKTPASPLLEELRASPSHPDEPARKAGERFTAYRRARKVGDEEGARSHSRADFHSFRRWFVTKAEQAGQPPHLISAVVGHEEGRKGMTLGTYSGGPSDAQLLAVVEAVQLPPSTPIESPPGPTLGGGRKTP